MLCCRLFAPLEDVEGVRRLQSDNDHLHLNMNPNGIESLILVNTSLSTGMRFVP